MSRAYICDRCGRVGGWLDHHLVVSRKFAITNELDLCRSCWKEFDNLYHEWLREGRRKG